MIRIVTSRRLRDLRERAALYDEIAQEQEDARRALSSPNRAERRRAHRTLWRELPKPENGS